MKTKYFMSMILMLMAASKVYGGTIVTVEESATALDAFLCWPFHLGGDLETPEPSTHLIALAKGNAINEAINLCNGSLVDRVSDWDLKTTSKCRMGSAYSYAPTFQLSQTVVASAQFECLGVE